MAHVRTQIRSAMKSALEAGLSSSYKVFDSRKYARNIVDGEAIVDMRINDDRSGGYEVMGDERTHTASLFIRVQRSATEATIDDALDEDEVDIVAIVEATDWSSLLEQDPELIQVGFSDDSTTAQPIAAIVFQYDVEYRIDKSDPETVIE